VGEAGGFIDVPVGSDRSTRQLIDRHRATPTAGSAQVTTGRLQQIAPFCPWVVIKPGA